MTLQQEEYRIEDGGIWISKAVLEEWRNHYFNVAKECNDKMDYSKQMYYFGRTDYAIDLLKMFEPLEP